MSDRTLQIRDVRFKKPVPLDIALGVTYKLHEPWMVTFLERVLKPKDVFLDVGANVGQTLLSAVAVRPDVHYYGFEASPDCVVYLKQLVQKNNLKNISIFPCGLSNKNEIASLWVTRGNPTSAGSTVVTGVKDLGKRAAEHVPLFTLDTVWKQFSETKISVMKVDVEGHEVAVLEGAREVIAEHKPMIVLEILPLRHEGDTTRDTARKDAQAFFDRQGYAIYHIQKTPDNDFVGIEKLPSLPDSIIDAESAFSTHDYVAVPHDTATALEAALSSDT